MKNQTLVSIITPLYNSILYFGETFLSVINQTLKDWEWIIVDDCSNDGSYELALKLAENNKKIIVRRLPKNSGSAAARNFGLDIARGKYVTFLDADDILDKNYLIKQCEFMKNNGPIITASYFRLSENTKTVFEVPEKTSLKTILKGNPLSCLTTMFDRNLFSDIRFETDLSRHEDYFFWICMLRKGYVANGNKEILATYRLSTNSKNRNKVKLIRPLFFLYHKKMRYNFIKSFIMVLRYVKYSRKKYKGVK